jgi:hypothetical protein
MRGVDVAEEEKIRKMAELRTFLEKHIEEIETELDALRSLLDFVNAELVDKGFKRAKITKPVVALPPTEDKWPPVIHPTEVEGATQPVQDNQHLVPIKTAMGELLANLYMDEDYLHVVIAEDKQFTVDIPPFMAFLIERVLVKMQQKDQEAAEIGEIPTDKILSYNIVSDGDTLREIKVRNVGPDRVRELKSTIRWTLEKMYEKMKTNV